MLNTYSGPKLRNLRKRALLTQMQVVELTGICERTIHDLEHGLRRPQTKTLEAMLRLYATRITSLERMERLWGEDGLQKQAPQPQQAQLTPARPVNPTVTWSPAFRPAMKRGY